MSQPRKLPETVKEAEGRSWQGRGRRLAQGIIIATARVALLLRIRGLEKVPRKGPVIYISNHLHNLDPVVEIAAFPRPIHWMAKEELWDKPIPRWGVRIAGCFPVDRFKVDRNSLRHAERLLDLGLAVGIYPEGTRSPTKSLQMGKSGVGFLVLRTGAPVIASAITGVERLPLNGYKKKEGESYPNPPKDHFGVRLQFGDPFTVPREIDGRKISSDEATEILMLEIARLLPPQYRGVYAELLERETVRRAQPWTPTFTG